MSLEAFVELSWLLTFCLPQLFVAEVPRACPTEKLTNEIRHQISLLPALTVFDHISYSVGGCKVTLTGYVTRPALKSAAEDTVRAIEGVELVVNRIDVLPVSSMDNALRFRVYRAIYEFPHLQKYAVGVNKPIRIIVKNANVILEGVVDCDADRDIAGFRAKGIADVVSVRNNLRLSSPS